MRLSWGPMASAELPAGYGTITKKLREALTALGVEIVEQTAFDYDLAVITGLPVAWALGPGASRRPDVIWHTMTEVEPLMPGWAEVINRSGGCWVPSRWVHDTFRASGVTAPMMTAGYGVDTAVFQPVERAGRSGPLRVLIWGRGLSSRKNLTKALRVYAAAGLEDAELEIKVNADDSLARDGMGVIGRDDVRVIARDWTTTQVARWLQGGDVLLYLSSGEGFGLMPLEAMATGLPVVCAANTGMMDYLDDQVAYLVPCRPGAPVETYRERFGYDARGFEPDFDAAVAMLRAVYDDRERASEIGQRAASRASLYTWERAGRRALQGLSQLMNGG